MKRATTFLGSTMVMTLAFFSLSPGTAYAAGYTGHQCSPGYRQPGNEQVCLFPIVDGGKLTGARATWRDNDAPVNDIDYEGSAAARKTGHFNIYGNGWTIDSPTRSYAHSSINGQDGGGYDFDLTDAPRPVQKGELICARFFENALSGTREWGRPACERQ